MQSTLQASQGTISPTYPTNRYAAPRNQQINLVNNPILHLLMQINTGTSLTDVDKKTKRSIKQDHEGIKKQFQEHQSNSLKRNKGIHGHKHAFRR